MYNIIIESDLINRQSSYHRYCIISRFVGQTNTTNKLTFLIKYIATWNF